MRERATRSRVQKAECSDGASEGSGSEEGSDLTTSDDSSEEEQGGEQGGPNPNTHRVFHVCPFDGCGMSFSSAGTAAKHARECHLREHSIHKGRQLERHFEGWGWFQGTVVNRFEAGSEVWFDILYEDGDRETVEMGMLAQFRDENKLRLQKPPATIACPPAIQLCPGLIKEPRWASDRVRNAMRKTVRAGMQSEEPILSEPDYEVPIRVAFVNQVKRWGAFASCALAKGEFIAEYCGVVEMEKVLATLPRSASVYLFELCHGFVIDATKVGNATRFLNASDDTHDANLDALVVCHYGTQRACFYASRDIALGEELLWSYGHDRGFSDLGL